MLAWIYCSVGGNEGEMPPWLPADWEQQPLQLPRQTEGLVALPAFPAVVIIQGPSALLLAPSTSHPGLPAKPANAGDPAQGPSKPMEATCGGSSRHRPEGQGCHSSFGGGRAEQGQHGLCSFGWTRHRRPLETRAHGQSAAGPDGKGKQ